MIRDDEVFGDALEVPTSERAAFLDRACAGDAALRARVERLLSDHAMMEIPGFLQAPLMPRDVVLPEEKAGDHIGRYKLLQKIGEGGCGTVYMAEQMKPVHRRVALKVIKLGMDTKAVIARFGAEQQALAMMDHPNIAKVLDGGATDAGRPFFVMELVRGVPITTYCDEHLLSTPARLALFTQVCRAIEHAHQNGIIHRDIKPSNILVTLHDGIPTPKVIDFGIAKATQGRLTDATFFTAFEQFMGTPAYMSPEQAEISSTEIDRRSDIYSLGVLLYELLTGRTPFEAKALIEAGLDEMRRQIREVDPPRPSIRLRTLEKSTLTSTAHQRRTDPPKLISLIHGDLDWIVMRCLEKNRTRRYETAHRLADDIVRHLEHQPVSARPPSATYRLGKAIRRHKAALAIGVVLLIGGGGWIVDHWGSPLGRRMSPGAADATPVPEKSIALMPFVNLSTEPKSEYFADGIHDAILTNLFSLRSLRVISSTSMEHYRKNPKPIAEIARELGVAYILEGNVRRTGGRASVTVRLIQAANERQVWAKAYERDLSDVFSIQAALSIEIASSLRLALSPEEKSLFERRLTANPAAYDLYLKGRELSNQVNNITGAGAKEREIYYQGAVDLDPNFAAAWGELAFLHSYNVYANIDHTPARLARADAAMARALSLAPDAPEVILAHGNYLYHAQRENARAVAQFERAIGLQPNHADAYYFLALVQRSQTRQVESLANLLKASALDPGSARNWREVARTNAAGRRWNEALAAQRRVNALQTTQLPGQGTLAELAFWSTGLTGEADDWLAGLTPAQFESPQILHARKYWAMVKRDFAEWKRLDTLQPYYPRPNWKTAVDAAMMLATAGDQDGARARLEDFPAKINSDLTLQPDNDVLWMARARMEAVLGQNEAALRSARKAAELNPESGDMFSGTQTSVNLAVVHAWAGNKDRAIDELARLLRLPFGIYSGVHGMRGDPAYGPLRGNPRFEALLSDPQYRAPLF